MMGAYTIPLSTRLCVKCKRRATCEVFNTYNASLGYHCTPCGKRVLA